MSFWFEVFPFGCLLLLQGFHSMCVPSYTPLDYAVMEVLAEFSTWNMCAPDPVFLLEELKYDDV